MKRFLFCASISLVMVLCLGLTGCSGNRKQSKQSQKAMVAILKNSKIDFWNQVAAGFSSECQAKGLVPLVYFTQDEASVGEQLEIIAALENLQYNIQGIAFAPIWTENDHRAEQAVADFASKHSVPVSIVDSPVNPETSPLKDIYVSYVGTDNTAAGQLLSSHIAGPADGILVVRDSTSTPTWERYQGVCAAQSQELNIWNTTLEGATGITGHLAGMSSIVFLTGHLLKEVLGSMEGYDVYTFDICSEYSSLLGEDSFLKGILVQNSLKMGSECVKDLLSAPQSKNHFISPIYFDAETLENLPEEARPIMEFLQGDHQE